MYKSMNRKIMFVCLLWLLSTAVTQAAHENQFQKAEGTRQMTGQTQGHMGTVKLCSINKLLDADVKNNRNEKLGSVDEVILDNNHDKIQYVVLSADSKLHPVPWSAFDMSSSKLGMDTTKSGMNVSEQRTTDANMRHDAATDQNTLASRVWGQEKILILNISKEQLGQAPTVDSTDVSNLSSSSLKQQIDDFYSRTGSMRHTGSTQDMSSSRMEQRQRDINDSNASSWMGQRRRDTAATSRDMQSGQANLFKTSYLIGLNIKNLSDENIGEIKDIVIDVHQGNLAYCLVSFGGVLGVAKDVAAVPWSSIDIQPDLSVAKLDATADILKTAVIDENRLDRLSEQQFARRIHESFGTKPYWEVFGYVPGKEGETGLMDAWRPGSKFNQKFDPTKTTSIEGTIEEVSTFEPEKGAAPGVQLKVKARDDKSMTVYIGPQDYLTQQGITFRTGSDIKVTGSKIREGLKSVIIASEVATAGKTARLRDSQGNPQWKSESMQQQRQRGPMNQKSDQQQGQNKSDY